MQYKDIYSDVFQNCASYNSQSININYVLPMNYIINNDNIKTHIDISAGRGNFINLIKSKTNVISTFTDIKKFNNLDNNFIQIDLSNESDLNKLSEYKFDVLTCLDVLQHIEHKYIDNILQCFAKISKNCLLTIANHQDIYNGKRLHIIVQNIDYWIEKIEKYFLVKYKDIYLDGKLFYFELERK